MLEITKRHFHTHILMYEDRSQVEDFVQGNSIDRFS